MAFSATMAALTAASAVGGLALNASRSTTQPTDKEAINIAGLRQAAANQQNQALVQALVNQRAVAGSTDSMGNTLTYDPATNTWKTTLGALPQATQTAADQASISRNTTDLQQAQFENAQNAQRAALAQPAADAARRNLADFRPMQANDLVGLLGQQATNASNATFRPLVQDTLRTFARTGTAAGPVLGQLGRDASQNLRNSLIDAQIKGMTSVGDVNNQRLQGLQSAAATTGAEANPNFSYSQINPSDYAKTMAQLASQRASYSPQSTAAGMAGANAAGTATQKAYETAAAGVPDPNTGLVNAMSDVNSLGALTSKGGALYNLGTAIPAIKSFFSSTTPTTQTTGVQGGDQSFG